MQPTEIREEGGLDSGAGGLARTGQDPPEEEKVVVSGGSF